MGFVNLAPGIAAMTGRVGNAVYARLPDGRVIVRPRPIRTAPARAGERIGQERLKVANVFVKAMMSNPAHKAAYQAAAKALDKRAWDLAMIDFLNPPEIRDIDASGYLGHPGDRIRIKAWDKFAVLGVQVELRDLAGNLLEQGVAVQDVPGSELWIYAAATTVAPGQTIRIQGVAVDRPGNEVLRVIDRAL